MTRNRFGWFTGISVAGAAVASLGLSSALPIAQAAPASPGATSATVVKTVTRAPIGKMLAAASNGHSLYVLSTGTCTGSCLQAWPPLLMPKGATVPKGASCLATAKSSGGRLQVTYHKKRLYFFASDTATSVMGNGVAGFFAAKVTGKCP